jgi:peptide/nickel transport system ATP-binding protein
VADRVGVMYLGKLVELAPAEMLFSVAAHPYTTALLAAAPAPEPKAAGRRRALAGEIPSATKLPSGCRFRTRCPKAQAVCAEIEPPLVSVRTGHEVACHFPDLAPADSGSRKEQTHVGA